MASALFCSNIASVAGGARRRRSICFRIFEMDVDQRIGRQWGRLQEECRQYCRLHVSHPLLQLLHLLQCLPSGDYTSIDNAQSLKVTGVSADVLRLLGCLETTDAAVYVDSPDR